MLHVGNRRKVERGKKRESKRRNPEVAKGLPAAAAKAGRGALVNAGRILNSIINEKIKCGKWVAVP